MPKCRSCNDKDLELLTRWERIRNWLFWKTNDIFFGEDMRDLTSHKYTTGFGAGHDVGVNLERARQEANLKKYGA